MTASTATPVLVSFWAQPWPGLPVNCLLRPCVAFPSEGARLYRVH